MTSTITIDPRFGTITGMGGPNASPLIALAGPYHRVLHAEKTGERLVFLGESADLGAEVLAANNQSSPNFHVLTAAGVTVLDDSDAPAVVSTFDFDPGGGRWLALFGSNFLATPLPRGGVQVIHSVTGAIISTVLAASDSRFAAALPARGYLWVADSSRAVLHTFKVNVSTGALQYIGATRAPNCRDVLKVVLDADNGNLFVLCRRRIVRFVAPLTAVDEPLPVFAQDYGIADADYTDFVVIGENQYWVGQNVSTAPTPLDEFRGPLYGVWDPNLGSVGELVVAAPKASLWTVNNVIPFYTEDSLDGDPDTVLPDPPVITSDLTDSAEYDEAWTYAITATGDGPIVYSVTDPPDWLSVDPSTGIIGGTIPEVDTVYDFEITATNAGGTDTEHLLLTVSSVGWHGTIASIATTPGSVTSDSEVCFGSLIYRYDNLVASGSMAISKQSGWLSTDCIYKVTKPDLSVVFTLGTVALDQVGRYILRPIEKFGIYEDTDVSGGGTISDSVFRVVIRGGANDDKTVKSAGHWFRKQNSIHVSPYNQPFSEDKGEAYDSNAPGPITVVNPDLTQVGAHGTISYVGVTVFRFSGYSDIIFGEGWAARFDTPGSRYLAVGGIEVGSGSVSVTIST